VGRKVVLTVQLAPTASEDGNGRKGFAPQVFVCAKRFLFAPPTAMLVMGSGTLPVLAIVTVWAALVTLIA